MTTTQTIITTLLGAFFVFASSIKLLGWQKMIFSTQLAFFVKYGLNRKVMFAVGAIEFLAAMLILSPLMLDASLANTVSLFGYLALSAVSLGAIACHLWFDTWRDGVPAVVTLTLSVALLLQGL
ncbi:DoxX family protein [Photobacterium satsumensis]|uniref:DoxX family protein n=1 Tax=Photobacterium satsumensis TaxID=2910239 RepID=UPI003D11A4B9